MTARRTFVANAGAALAVVLLTSSAFASNRNFHLLNQTRETITAAGVSLWGVPKWYMMDGPQIPPGESEYFTFDDDDLGGACQVQLKVQFDNGDEPEWDQGFNLCTTSRVRIYWDPDKNGYEAGYR